MNEEIIRLRRGSKSIANIMQQKNIGESLLQVDRIASTITAASFSSPFCVGSLGFSPPRQLCRRRLVGDQNVDHTVEVVKEGYEIEDQFDPSLLH